ncbi:M20 family metallopeptidase [Bacilliculturomica massiliensis]|uniref:M20 family metallopeptidase n=1 Tax=Bacilliculturomica massiliensis TaxID=1917867 RepID=UPI0013EF4DD8|nr:M20 family metallopeptidase [Bacilliculturomica massiliensis]
MTYEQMKERIIAEVGKYGPELAVVNDDIADHPEVSGQEYETSRKLVELLKAHGYRTEYPYRPDCGKPTAFRGIYGENDHKYKIALLVEYDALPELGHACGHCLSGAMSILAGLATRDLQDELNADIHLIGTPDEEDDGAKSIMAEKGAFDEYDMAMMVHLYNRNIVMPKFQALAEYFYEFHGKSAHASAAPWEGKNALNAVQLMCHAVDMLRQHTKGDAQFHSIIKEGGVAPNIVPEKAVLQMFIRAADKKYLEELIRLVDDCAKGAAIATQTTWEKCPQEQLYYVDLRENKTGERSIRERFEELGIPENGPGDLLFGSSDIGNVSYACPAFHPCLQVVDEAATHTREFAQAMKTDRAHKLLETGAELIGLQIANIFSDEEKIAGMKADFENNK